MHLKKNYINLLVLVIIFGIFIYTFHNTIMDLYLPTIHCDLDFEALINHIINGYRSLNLKELIVILSNLEHLQDLVRVPQNSYDIDINNKAHFFEMLFQAQDLSVEFVDGVFVNCIKVNNVIYTVHPDLISFLIHLFRILKFIINLKFKFIN